MCWFCPVRVCARGSVPVRLGVGPYPGGDADGQDQPSVRGAWQSHRCQCSPQLADVDASTGHRGIQPPWPRRCSPTRDSSARRHHLPVTAQNGIGQLEQRVRTRGEGRSNSSQHDSSAKDSCLTSSCSRLSSRPSCWTCVFLGRSTCSSRRPLCRMPTGVDATAADGRQYSGVTPRRPMAQRARRLRPWTGSVTCSGAGEGTGPGPRSSPNSRPRRTPTACSRGTSRRPLLRRLPGHQHATEAAKRGPDGPGSVDRGKYGSKVQPDH